MATEQQRDAESARDDGPGETVAACLRQKRGHDERPGGQPEPLHRLGIVLRHAMAKVVNEADVGTTIKYMAKRSDCAACPLQPQCTSGRERRISRDVNQDARDYTQALMQTETYEALKHWSKPVNIIFGADDPIFPPSWGKAWAEMIPGATFDAIERAGHFCQEDAGEEIAARLLERAAADGLG